MLVLGFDVREPLIGNNDRWTQERRSRFLIRPDVPFPLSIDATVWPKAIGNISGRGHIHLFNSIGEAVADYPSLVRPDETSPVLIEIGVFACEHSSEYWSDVISLHSKPETNEGLEGFLFYDLGYDVGDYGFISGMSNCSLSSIEIAGLRSKWQPTVNGLGLFDHLADASRYVSVCNRLIPEHAPFSVFRLRRLARNDE